jgi:transposase InsO family protein
MAPGLHGSARTTPRVRAELQAAQATTRALAASYGLNPKTVAKWRRRATTADQPMGPSRPRSTVLTEAEEAIVVEFRRRTLLPLDDVLGCLREAIPTLSRSALHRCLQRHGISRLPRDDEKASKRKRFAETRIGYVHIDVCELRLAQGKLFLFLAIDRVSKFTHIAFLDANTKLNGAAFLREVVAAFPYRLHTVLTDNGMAFADLPKYRDGATARWMGHIFDRVCREHGIEHRLTKPYHPWTNGQAERMNRTSRRPRSRRSTTPISRRSRPTSRLSCAPTTSPSTSRHCAGEPPSRRSATPGPRTRPSSRSIRTTSSRDHTPSTTLPRPRLGACSAMA